MSTIISTADSRNLAIGFARLDGKVYNFTTKGWDTPATDGVPTSQQILPFTRVSSVAGSPLASSQAVVLHPPVTDNPDWYVNLYALGVGGAVTETVDTLSIYRNLEPQVRLSVGSRC